MGTSNRVRKSYDRPAEEVLGNKTLFSLWMKKDPKFITPVWSENYTKAAWRVFSTESPKLVWSPIVKDEWSSNLLLYDLWGITPRPEIYYDPLEYIRRYYERREKVGSLLKENGNFWQDVHGSWIGAIYYKRLLSPSGRMCRGAACKYIDAGMSKKDVFTLVKKYADSLHEHELFVIVEAAYTFVERFGAGVTDPLYRQMLSDKYLNRDNSYFDSIYYDL